MAAVRTSQFVISSAVTALERRIGTITPKVLTQRLRVEYEISDLGRSLAPLFASLARWSGAHLDPVEQAQRDYDTLSRPSSS